MDLSPKPLDEAHYAVTHLPEVARDLVAASLAVVAPQLSSNLADQTASFIAAQRRVCEAQWMMVYVDARSLKKMGMALSGFLLRCRELSLRWRSFEASVNELLAVWDPPVDLRFPTDRSTDGPEAPPFSSEWPVPQGIWLRDRLNALFLGLEDVEPLAIAITVPKSDERRLVWLTQLAEEFRLEALPALAGEDGLLKCLPRVQEEITRLIYREEFAA
jgi:hypothetical protein